MNNHLPKIKTIRVMLQEMGEQQQAVFRMAFKMHNTTNYVIVSPDSDEKPDLVLVDTDTPAGVEAWKESKKNLSGSACGYVFFRVADSNDSLFG